MDTFVYQESTIYIYIHIYSRRVDRREARRHGHGYLSHNIIPPGDTTVGEEWEPKPKEQST